MSKAVNLPTTSRRLMLAAVPAALMLSGVALPAIPNASPDAELIGLCADLDAIERRVDGLFDPAVSGLSFEDADAAAQVIEVGQRSLVDRICALTPVTDEGVKALARSLGLLSPDYAEPYIGGGGAMDERLAHVIVRGVMERACA